MTSNGMVYAANSDKHLIALTEGKGFMILQLDSGPVEIGDTLTSDDEGVQWFNMTRKVCIVAYAIQRGIRPSDLREYLYPKLEADRSAGR